MFLHFIQDVPDGKKESSGGQWQFIGHDSAETIRWALNLGVNVKMITRTLHMMKTLIFLYLWHFKSCFF